ncbi:MAG: hypothetical protein Q7T97_09955 [Burkholderiaceae bacterium]|nr:hypothetical protein [Burkholderiaceae bacterium]
MSMEAPKRPPITAPLAHRIDAGAQASQIAEAIEATWLEIHVALTPIVGERGLVALYKRSLYLAASAHPWLEGLHEGVQSKMDLAGLKAAVSQQSSADAAAGGCDIFRAFHDLLESMVGPSLTERLLRSVWALHPHGPAAQDKIT